MHKSKSALLSKNGMKMVENVFVSMYRTLSFFDNFSRSVHEYFLNPNLSGGNFFLQKQNLYEAGMFDDKIFKKISNKSLVKTSKRISRRFSTDTITL